MADAGNWFWAGLRVIYGLFFAVIGGLIALTLLQGGESPFEQPTEEAAAFVKALSQAPFFDALLSAVYIAGGIALIVPRTTPLGLVLLAPPTVVIFLFHLFLSGQIAIGAATAAIWSLLALRHIDGLAPLWRYRSSR